MPKIPSTLGFDSTLALLVDGYEFIPKRCDRLQSDVFQTRFLLKETICFRGKEAAQVFYDTEKFSRKKAAPKHVKKTLLGEGGVQGLDGQKHRQRKEIFMLLMTPEHMEYLGDLTEQQWYEYARKWEQQEQVVLFHELEKLLCQAVCTWSGVPLPESEVVQRTQDMSAMIDGSGGVGLRNWQGVWARNRAEDWMKDVLTQIRNRQLEVPENTAAHTFAWHRDEQGNLMDLHAAAVDLLNVLRPTVAIARYITFAALALHQHPEYRSQLQSNEANYQELFTQEVRRFFPFFPFAAACVSHDFDWQGYHFPEGVRVLLDLYGTNRDPDLWENPETFFPERFVHWEENSFDFIPQGGGNYYTNHRCAGEWVTIRLVKRALNFLVNQLDYDIPSQNLNIDLSRIPAIPESRLIISNIRIK